jgi:hypothetical protein
VQITETVPIMKHLDQLAQVEERAKRLGLSLTATAIQSKVYPAYLSRWKNGSIPRVDTFGEVMDRLTAYLDQVEAQRQAGASS